MVTLPMRTARLLLRPFFASDGDALYDCLSDEETVRFEAYPPLTRELAHYEAAARAENADFIAVCLPPDEKEPDGHLIGFLFFGACDFQTAELGYLFNRAYWHNGYAAEACYAVMREAFASGEIHRIAANCNAENTASYRLMERLGMRREGLFRKSMYFHTTEDGTPLWHDTLYYAILKEEFLHNEQNQSFT